MLVLSQTSAWNHWRHDIKDAHGNTLGHIQAPTWAQATNSRLGVVSREDAVAAHMALPDANFVIRFEHLRRGWTNDVAWWLETAEGKVLSRIERIFPPEATGLPRHLLRTPDTGELKVFSARKLRPFDVRLDLSDGRQVLRIATRQWLRLKLALQVDGDFGSVAQRAFWAYYALHLR
jgi:hypothetical protein